MVFNQIGTIEVNCITGGDSSIFKIEQDGVLTIIPFGDGTGTATLMVANDDDNYEPFNIKTNDYDVTEPIMINGCSFLNWKVVVNAGGTGTINFRFALK